MSSPSFIFVAFGCRFVADSRVSTGLEILAERGFVIEQRDQRILTESQAASLGRNNLSAAEFVGLPVILLLLKRTDAFAQFNLIRDQFDYTYASESGWVALRDRAEFFPSKPKFERSLILIKPDASENSIAQLKKTLEIQQFAIIKHSAIHITAEGASNFLSGDQSIKEDEAKYLSSGDSHVIVVERLNAVELLLLLSGPMDPIEAREIASLTPSDPYNSLRSQFGSSLVKNFIYVSPTVDSANNLIKLLFPNPFPIESILSIIDPILVEKFNLIEEFLRIHGFTIIGKTEIYMSKSQTELFAMNSLLNYYSDELNNNNNFSSSNIQNQFIEATIRKYNQSSLPSLALILSKPAAIESWRIFSGHKNYRIANKISLRSQFSSILESNEISNQSSWNEFDKLLNNGFYGSTNIYNSLKEIKSFFPLYSSNYEKIPEMNQLNEYLHAKQEKSIPAAASSGGASANPTNKSIHDVLVDGLTQLCRVRPQGDDAILWLSDWLARNNPNKPKVEIPEESNSAANATAAAAAVPLKKLIWLCGVPYTGKKQVGQAIKTVAPHYEHIDLGLLLKFHQQTNTEFGQIISQHRAQFRPVPIAVCIQLIQQAVKLANSSHLIITNVPASIDDAFQLERALGKSPDSIVQLSATISKGELWIPMKSQGKLSLKQYKNIEEELEQVIEHYTRFNKIFTIHVNENTETEDIIQQIKQIL